MSEDKDFLTPRGLLVGDSFLPDNVSFNYFRSIIGAIFFYPTNVELFGIYYKFTPAGLEVLGDAVAEALRGLQKIHGQYGNLNMAFLKVGSISNGILALAQTAQEDYDFIFDGLSTLYEEPDNEELRTAVTAKIEGRLTVVRKASVLATEVRDTMHEATDYELSPGYSHILEAGKILFFGARRRLRESLADNAEFTKNAFALIGTKGRRRRWTDLVHLIDRVERGTKPGSGPRLELNKRNILARWAKLEEAVKKFNSDYYNAPFEEEELELLSSGKLLE